MEGLVVEEQLLAEAMAGEPTGQGGHGEGEGWEGAAPERAAGFEPLEGFKEGMLGGVLGDCGLLSGGEPIQGDVRSRFSGHESMG